MADTIIHGQFKHKNEKLKYDMLYPENNTDDVVEGDIIKINGVPIIDSKDKIHNLPYEKLNTILNLMIDRCNNRIPYTLRDNSLRFELNNPVLYKDQLAVETDTGRMKAGDGKTAYNNLKYINYIK